MNYEQLSKQYQECGLLQLENYYDQAKVDQIERQLKEYIARIDPEIKDARVVYEAGSRRKIRNIFEMQENDEYFAGLASAPQMIDLIRALLNDEPISMGVELFAKPAKVGSEVPYHQDNAYFNLVPDDALTVWLALADATVENGCVRYLEGSHKLGNLPHRASGVKGNSMGLCEVPAGKWPEVCGSVKRGGILIHH